MWAVARGSWVALAAIAACESRGETTHVGSRLDDEADDDHDDDRDDHVGQIAEAAPQAERWVGPTHARAVAAATDDGVAGCAAYCRAFETTCATSPFAALEACTARCSGWPTGVADEVGDTLACRTSLLTSTGSCIGASPESPICRTPRVARAGGRPSRASAL